jgi:hypothetical protein
VGDGRKHRLFNCRVARLRATHSFTVTLLLSQDTVKVLFWYWRGIERDVEGGNGHGESTVDLERNRERC